MTLSLLFSPSLLASLVSLSVATTPGGLASASGNLATPSGDLRLTDEPLTFTGATSRQTVISQAVGQGMQIQDPLTLIFVAPTPTPTPVYHPPVASPSTTPTSPPDLVSLFNTFSTAFGVDPQKLMRIANCESHFHAGSVSGTGTYLGMFQYSSSTWSSTRSAMGEDPNPDLRADASEAIKTSAWKIAHGGIDAWPVCGKL